VFFATFSAISFADGNYYRCTAGWETCQEWGHDQVEVMNTSDACDALYKKTAADLVYGVDCQLISEDGSAGPVVFHLDRCE